jgi:hypothetical protein
MRVCQIMVRRPRWIGVASAVTRVPTGAGATKLVLLSTGRRARPLRQIDDRAHGAERVGERHDRAAVQHGRYGAKILPDGHLGDNSFRCGADELDAQEFGKRQLGFIHPVEQIQLKVPPSGAAFSHAQKHCARFSGNVDDRKAVTVMPRLPA